MYDLFTKRAKLSYLCGQLINRILSDCEGKINEIKRQRVKKGKGVRKMKQGIVRTEYVIKFITYSVLRGSSIPEWKLAYVHCY